MKLYPLVGAIPFVGMLGGLPWANTLTPFVLGMPFILFWFVLWIVLFSVCMGVMYTLDPINRRGDQHE